MGERTLDEVVATAASHQHVWLTTEDLAQRFRTSPSTCRYWRHTGYGPQGVSIGRRVLYDLTEVERWEAARVAEAKA